MQNLCLYRPGSKPISFDSLLNRNRHILMPGNLPIRTGNLVEEDSSYWKKTLSENWLDQHMDGR